LAFGEARITDLLAKTTSSERFAALTSSIEKHLDGEPPHDDISFALINIGGAEDAEISSLQPNSTEYDIAGGDWRIAVTLGADELKYLDIVPLLTQIIAKIAVTREHHSALFMILSELFNNALDHGLLCLDSALKMGRTDLRNIWRRVMRSCKRCRRQY